jgi:hypothetical protein
MNLVQINVEGKPVAGVVSDGQILQLNSGKSVYELALQAFEQKRPLQDLVAEEATSPRSYEELEASQSLLPPITHPDPAHLLVSGTGLTHLGSADARDSMHKKVAQEESALTDSMKMFKWGLEGGKPGPGETGVQPEWFYKGDGGILKSPHQPLPAPEFGLDFGEEPELVGVYVIAGDGTPLRLGFCLGNEASDHVTERQNYLYLAHSKLRCCSIGPELRLGAAPGHIVGTSRVVRAGESIWEKPFFTGEQNMSHSLANLEHHHFKYSQFRRPGDVHVHFFGTATLSCMDGIQTEPGDRFEISAPEFGRPLANPIAAQPAEAWSLQQI